MRRFLPLLLAALTALPLFAEDPVSCADGNLLREWRGSKTSIAGEEYHVVRDAEAWKALWKRHSGESVAPAVEFGHEMIVAVFNAGDVEVGWVRVTRVATPGLSHFWVGLCAATDKCAFQIAVTGRTDLEVEFWKKDPSLVREPGVEPESGGFAVEAGLVQGAAGRWRGQIPALDEARRAQAEAEMVRLGSEDAGEREAATRGLLRLGAGVRSIIEAHRSTDAEVNARCSQILAALPTFDTTGAVMTREHSLWIAKEFLVAHHPDLFSNDSEMRWEDWGARYHAGPAWTTTLRYL